MIRPEVKPFLDAMKTASADLCRLSKSTTINLQERLDAIEAFRVAGHAALDEIEKAFELDAAEPRWFHPDYAKAAGAARDEERIAALERELADLKFRHRGDIAGLEKTLRRGAPTIPAEPNQSPSCASAVHWDTESRARFGRY
ncbi:hypothetical protein M2323_001983 [Rhodoblastus acidophilus]|uniref:hypothetical protein n=1 Tax=Rhodoblastus acidophilus TaxID=1074 RepID=UPI0022250B05|nr:hypothetical protein [Rhodoblastus acidophilus]MCW2285689.1 hypothetical protein [Rhodoblastus acidophilus]MCW2333061.1 hypothetical protein [Rhodoblastus acidophilus]